MANTYDQINKLKAKYTETIANLEETINDLKEKLKKAEEDNKDLRKKLYDAGEGKGERNKLERIIVANEREKKTLENKIKDLDGSKLINTFKPEKQELIRRIKKLHFSNYIFNSLAHKFQDGLDNVIEIAYRIKNNSADDLSYYTFVFRDDIVCLLEKMLRTVLKVKEDSASKYLVKLRDNVYKFPKEYIDRIPELKNKNVINNILNLINLESIGYHGSSIKGKHLKTNLETNEKEHPNKFLNLSNDEQLIAIFTLLEFMYDIFTNKDHELNLLDIAQSWFKTI